MRRNCKKSSRSPQATTLRGQHARLKATFESPELRLVLFSALSDKNSSGASLEASTRACKDEPLAGRFGGELVGERRGEIDLLALGHQVALILGTEHRLRSSRRHEPVGTEDGHLDLQGRHVERFIAGVVVGRHLVGDLLGRVRVHPLERLDVGVDQLLPPLRASLYSTYKFTDSSPSHDR